MARRRLTELRAGREAGETVAIVGPSGCGNPAWCVCSWRTAAQQRLATDGAEL